MKYGEITIHEHPPSKSNSYKIVYIGGHSSLAKTPALKAFEKSFFWQVGHYKELNIDCPFKIWVDVYFRSRRSDLDNAFKILLDCLQITKTIKNDNLCSEIHARKFVDKENPRIVFHIETEDNED